MSFTVLRDNWTHLRLPFQLSLAPIFLWGCYLAPSPAAWRVLAAFVGFHLFLYPGVTAFNSFYDRDSGPVGGLERPPSIHPSLLPVGLVLQLAGQAVVIFAGPVTAIIYLIAGAPGFLYSHPRTRWK